MLDIVPPSTSVKSQITDGLCLHNSSELKVRLGQEATARQRRRWDEWIITAKALDFGGAKIMRNPHTNQPTGRRYEKAIRAINGFREIDEAARCRLFGCFQSRDEIKKWRALLTEGERFLSNYQGALLRRWKAAAAVTDFKRYAEAVALLDTPLEHRAHHVEPLISAAQTHTRRDARQVTWNERPLWRRRRYCS